MLVFLCGHALKLRFIEICNSYRIFFQIFLSDTRHCYIVLFLSPREQFLEGSHMQSNFVQYRSIVLTPYNYTFSSDSKTLKWSYQHCNSNTRLLGKTIGIALEEAVLRTPDRTAAVFCATNKRLTFEQLLKEANIFIFTIFLKQTTYE